MDGHSQNWLVLDRNKLIIILLLVASWFASPILAGLMAVFMYKILIWFILSTNKKGKVLIKFGCKIF